MLDDIQAAVRSLSKAPSYCAIGILTLSLGIGANTAVFSVMNAAMLEPLPYHEPDRLVRITLERRGEHRYFPGAGFVDLRANSRTIDVASTFTYTPLGADLTDGSRPERVALTHVSANYFDVLGARLVAGRTFTSEEERPQQRIAIVSERVWRTYFGGSRQRVGEFLSIDGTRMAVVGAVSADFKDPLRPDVEIWLPENLQPTEVNAWGNNRLTAIGRLRPGATLQDAATEAAVLVEAQADNYGASYPTTVQVEPLQTALVGGARPMLIVLLAAVGLLLLLACMNIASLSLARGVARAPEIAIRSALGSSRWRIIRQLLAESLLLSLAGGAAGLLLAVWMSRMLLSAAPVPLMTSAGALNGPVFVYCLAIAVLSGVGFGVVPALQVSRPDLESTLRQGGRSAGSGRQQTRTWNVLVAAQVALALVLLVGAGLLVRTVQRLKTLDLGVRDAGVLTFQVNLPGGRYDTAEARLSFHRTLHERIAALPGVRAAGAISRLPVTGSYHPWSVRLPGSDSSGWGEHRVIEGDYFAAMNIPLLRGRTFGRQDSGSVERRVVIAQSLASRLFGESDPLGRRIEALNFQATIIGVVGDVALTARGVTTPAVYHPHAQWADNRNWPLTQVVATDGDPLGLVAPLRNTAATIDGALVLHDPVPLSEVIGRGRARERFAGHLLGAFAGLAVLLAALGIYGVLAFSVMARRTEIGIRLALGAPVRNVLALFVRRAGGLTAVGVSVGAITAALLARGLDAMVFGVSVHDPAAFIIAAALLTAVALLAAWLPARAATRVDPLEVLGR